MLPFFPYSGMFKCKDCGHLHYVDLTLLDLIIPRIINPIKCPKCGSLKQYPYKKVHF